MQEPIFFDVQVAGFLELSSSPYFVLVIWGKGKHNLFCFACLKK